MTPDERLDSWKAIATYLNRGVRTVQRWEQTAGLPVRRLSPDKKASVFAYRSELDAWWTTRAPEMEEAAPAQSQPAKSSRYMMATVVLGAVVLVLVWWMADHRARPVPMARVVPLTTLPGREDSPAFSPDGTRIAFSWSAPGQAGRSIYILVIGAGGTPLRVTSGTETDSRPSWSPDGRYLSFCRAVSGTPELKLMVAPSLGGPERELAELPVSYDLPGPFQIWSRDGKSILAADRKSGEDPFYIVAIDVESGERHAITSPPANSGGDVGPALSGDGRTLAFVRSSSATISDVYTVPFDRQLRASGEPKRITHMGAEILSLMVPAVGEDLYFADRKDGAVMLWRSAISGGGTPQLVPGVGRLGAMVTMSNQGDRIAYSERRSNADLWRLDLPLLPSQPAAAKHLTSSTRDEINARISPDGQRLAFASSRTGQFEVWTSDANGDDARQMTHFGAGSPRWSPDSRQIAFDTRINGNADIYIVSANGGKPAPFTTEASDDVVPSWSRDGKFIYFTSNRGDKMQVWKKPVAGGPAVQLTHGGGFDAIESADGKYVYFARSYGPTSMWQVPSGGGEEVKVFDGLAFPMDYDVDSTGIYYFGGKRAQALPPVLFYSFATRESEVLTTLPFASAIGISVAPDKKWLLVSGANSGESDLMMVENFR